MINYFCTVLVDSVFHYLQVLFQVLHSKVILVIKHLKITCDDSVVVKFVAEDNIAI